ncbi:SulP family inorganic anion transporter [Ottowia sp.]|uniref:SulP family inorganic anion transporter n=1 Tax=Ottowia sp. TaxID=1898956 RepID=UPI002CCC1AB8|nr:SulP family inorganic anion transporter [Ottowia sp.]HRN74509.1 SulP family inorganic anion transporter [Ottowia sp.]HRQ02035.1 SulP family inorganic anion transporter [Ottowia sp.]
MPPRIERLLPFLRWPRPSAALLRGEAMAGLAVGLMVIPQGVAYAQLAGMPLVTGIYASMLPALAAVLFSASARLSVGPTALTSLLIYASLSPLATPASPEWVELAVWLALLSGGLQVVLGAARFGWLLNLVNSPVLMAFTQAAAILIISSQLPALLGFRVGWAQMLQTPSLHGVAAAFGLVALALLMLARRWRPTYPTVLVIVVAAAALSWAMGLEANGVAVVGPLPGGLPATYLPGWPGWQMLGQLVLPTLVITLVSFLETAASAKVDSQRKGERWDQDQDLIGQGLAKIVSGFSGAFATSSSFSRSALNLYAGAQTGWATVFSVVVVLAALLVFTPVLRHVPQAVLAAIVVAAVVGLLKPREFLRLWHISRVEACIAAITFVITIAAAPALYWGVLAGVLMALSYFLYQRLHPRIIEVGLHADGSLRDRHLWQLPALAPLTYALRMDAALDFATASQFERNVTEYLTAHPSTRHVYLLAQPINRMDATGAEAFARLMTQLQQRRVTLHISGMKLPVEQVLQAVGALAPHPLLQLYRTDAEAVAALKKLAEKSHPLPADLPAAAI